MTQWSEWDLISILSRSYLTAFLITELRKAPAPRKVLFRDDAVVVERHHGIYLLHSNTCILHGLLDYYHTFTKVSH